MKYPAPQQPLTPAQQSLVTEALDLVGIIARSAARRRGLPHGLTFDDLEAELYLALVVAASRYRPRDAGSVWLAFATQRLQWEAKNVLRRPTAVVGPTDHRTVARLVVAGHHVPTVVSLTAVCHFHDPHVEELRCTADRAEELRDEVARVWAVAHPAWGRVLRALAQACTKEDAARLAGCSSTWVHKVTRQVRQALAEHTTESPAGRWRLGRHPPIKRSGAWPAGGGYL